MGLSRLIKRLYKANDVENRRPGRAVGRRGCWCPCDFHLVWQSALVGGKGEGKFTPGKQLGPFPQLILGQEGGFVRWKVGKTLHHWLSGKDWACRGEANHSCAAPTSTVGSKVVSPSNINVWPPGDASEMYTRCSSCFFKLHGSFAAEFYKTKMIFQDSWFKNFSSVALQNEKKKLKKEEFSKL